MGNYLRMLLIAQNIYDESLQVCFPTTCLPNILTHDKILLIKSYFLLKINQIYLFCNPVNESSQLNKKYKMILKLQKKLEDKNKDNGENNL